MVAVPGSRAQVQKLWWTGLVAPRHVGSFQPRDRTRVSCIGGQIFYHGATREALTLLLLLFFFFFFENALPGKVLYSFLRPVLTA